MINVSISPPNNYVKTLPWAPLVGSVQPPTGREARDGSITDGLADGTNHALPESASLERSCWMRECTGLGWAELSSCACSFTRSTPRPICIRLRAIFSSKLGPSKSAACGPPRATSTPYLRITRVAVTAPSSSTSCARVRCCPLASRLFFLRASLREMSTSSTTPPGSAIMWMSAFAFSALSTTSDAVRASDLRRAALNLPQNNGNTPDRRRVDVVLFGSPSLRFEQQRMSRLKRSATSSTKWSNVSFAIDLIDGSSDASDLASTYASMMIASSALRSSK
mmetsp:Transcript_29903/g.75227  ORF Transcript_29903/g.75227 Transcript_29903/m.75227 type:complete len:280 (-) Transcript_29903:2114-2953(-)